MASISQIHLIFATATALLVGCGDTGKPKLRSSEEKASAKSTPESDLKPTKSIAEKLKQKNESPELNVPVLRNLVNRSGREINATILAKKGNEIYFEIEGRTDRFRISTDQLSDDDQKFILRINEGGNWEYFQQQEERKKLLSKRVASWNRQLYNAEKEAEEYNLPVLIAFLFSNESKSEALERNVLFTPEFREWSKSNLALCLVEINPSENSPANDEKRTLAGEYGVVNNAALILSPRGEIDSFQVAANKTDTVKETINAIQTIIEDPSEAYPTRPRPYKKENSRGKGKGGGKGGR